MCIHQYVACGSCNARADEHVRIREIRTEVVYYHVDSDGDMCEHDDADYGDNVDCESDGYECSSCGNTFSALDHDCQPEDCDCQECEPALDNYSDPEDLIALRRTSDPVFKIAAKIPEYTLLRKRSVPFVLVTRERAEEIGEHENYVWDFDFRINGTGYTPQQQAQMRTFLTVEPEGAAA